MPDPDRDATRLAEPRDDGRRQREPVHREAGPVRDDHGLQLPEEDLCVDRRAVVARRHGAHVGAHHVAVDQNGECQRRARLRIARPVDRFVDVGGRAQRAGRRRQLPAPVEAKGQRQVEALRDDELGLVRSHPADRDARDRDSGRDQHRQRLSRGGTGRRRTRNPAAPTFPARTTAVSAPAAAQATATTAMPRRLTSWSVAR